MTPRPAKLFGAASRLSPPSSAETGYSGSPLPLAEWLTLSDHRFFANGAWVEASQLAAGDRLVCAMRQDSSPRGLRGRQAHAARARGVLLLQRLLGRRGEREAFRASTLRSLRPSRSAKDFIRIASEQANFLLERVFGQRAAGGVGAAVAGSNAPLRALQLYVRSVQQCLSLLWSELRVEGSRWANAGGREPALKDDSATG